MYKVVLQMSSWIFYFRMGYKKVEVIHFKTLTTQAYGNHQQGYQMA